MLVTQNNDGSLTVEIPYADVSGAVQSVLGRVPVAQPTFPLLVVLELAAQCGDAFRAANLVFDQAVTESVATAVQGLKDTRAADVAAKVGP